ncbi:Tol-Pal system protein TolB [Algicella marina]|uniref:Tol-Pal system protein TolB n=2 Tax=Algicella marina TaxID=2683284 RepID=A0A6P1TA48_9RHOB|nr:Tol-Pal system protein TolB [Algicella marina]
MMMPVAGLAQPSCPDETTICGTIESFSVEPLPFAAPTFVPENPGAADVARQLTDVVKANLSGTGLFREIPPEAHIGRITNFDAPVQFSDWSPINTAALVTGSVSTTSDGRIAVKFRLWDVELQRELGSGQQFAGPAGSWRRMAHKVSDQVYSRLTGEAGYFDSRIAFVSETGPKSDRKKRIAVMDQDGANVTYLTDDSTLVLAPRWSPDDRSIIFTSYASGKPQVRLLDVATLQSRSFGDFGQVAFAPRFSPDGQSVVMSLNDGANTDIYRVDLASGTRTRLTSSPAIETAPSYSPDGSQIVFESDRSGQQQLYVMPASGGEGNRISFGQGKYGTPVWSPRGDLIAFTKINQGRFHIGVMRTDGSDERLLTTSFLDEAPTWSPNGRVISFLRETEGEGGAPSLWTVDITGRNLKRLPTPNFASDPGWSGLLP